MFSHAADASSFDIDTWILKIRGSGLIDLDSTSCASSGAVGGEVYDVQHFGSPESAVANEPVTLLFAPFTPGVYSPSLEITHQGGSE